MIDIYVLEDNVNQQFRIERMIDELLDENQWDYRHFEIFSEPSHFPNFVEESCPQIFFLDIDINGDNKKGIEVAKKIREKSRTATIVFVTTHSEFMLLTYRAQVSALDFIDKADEDSSIKINLKIVCERSSKIRLLRCHRNFLYLKIIKLLFVFRWMKFFILKQLKVID
jgi:Response regulator of the LytR/AlgR family